MAATMSGQDDEHPIPTVIERDRATNEVVAVVEPDGTRHEAPPKNRREAVAAPPPHLDKADLMLPAIRYVDDNDTEVFMIPLRHPTGGGWYVPDHDGTTYWRDSDDVNRFADGLREDGLPATAVAYSRLAELIAQLEELPADLGTAESVTTVPLTDYLRWVRRVAESARSGRLLAHDVATLADAIAAIAKVLIYEGASDVERRS